MLIRSPEPEDNEELIQLDRVAPEEGLISYYVDRRPRYIRQPDAEGFFPYVAEEDGRIVGVIFSSIDELHVTGEPRTCDYISSLRVHPEYRRRGIGSALIDRAVERGKEGGADVFWAVIMGKNSASSRTFKKCGFEIVGGHGFRVLTSKGRKRFSDASLREAAEGDFDDVVTLFSSFHKDHNFKPMDTRKWLMSRYRVKERSLGNVYVAERDGRIVATVRATRQWKTTKMIITKLSLSMRLFSALLRLGIEEGSPLKMLDLGALSYSQGDEMAAVDLMNFARRRFRDECRIGFVQYALGGKEEKFMAKVKGFPGYSDVMAMGPGLRSGKLDPIFPPR
ncbi:MAG: GNAT family N-acetyltransferase [Thermoplasmata archaeon]|nr:GNAT family N-acetyltransferase [Thermoplasmata archaeon]